MLILFISISYTFAFFYIHTFVPLYILFYFYFLHNYTTLLTYFYIRFFTLLYYTFTFLYFLHFFYSFSSSYLSHDISYLSFITITYPRNTSLSSYFSPSFSKNSSKLSLSPYPNHHSLSLLIFLLYKRLTL